MEPNSRFMLFYKHAAPTELNKHNHLFGLHGPSYRYFADTLSNRSNRNLAPLGACS